MNTVCIFFVSNLPSHPDVYVSLELGTKYITYMWSNLHTVNIFNIMQKHEAVTLQMEAVPDAQCK
jgi:hypothetical protein